MKKSELKKIIKEEISKIDKGEKVKPPQKDVTKLTSSSLMKMINNKVEWEQLVSTIIGMDVMSLSPSHRRTFLLKKVKELSKK